MTHALAAAPYAIDGGLYTWVTGLAARAPGPWNAVVSLWTDVGLAVFAVFMVAAWWRARSGGEADRIARALAAPLVVVAAYGVNDVVKSLVDEQRPCQVLHTVTVQACPSLGDWSFPSNHAAIAAAAAVALLQVDRRIGALAAVCALLMGASRVWVGAHYPHDVAAGLVLGAAVAWLLTRLFGRAAPLVTRLHTTRLRPLVSDR
ncbi:phosphatase PAP2 family protein [Streptomyces pinistramenti]|uniref:phosphatase PAP2 family protein n=1 Tax=Streptomyces pinistramenti TaxID=2884812 RepID=UPI001D08808E|nr:phosphatase PAP2 family protein [Streptomyces pinistramenti]MCB5909111.1 phosphatase PAP2 family protein [Streptomyces pinistramenti]